MFGFDLSWLLYIGLAIFMFYMMSKGGGCCAGHGGHGGHGRGPHTGHDFNDSHGDGSAKYAVNRDINTFKDPVCGMYVSKRNAIIRQIDGQTYYFCSERCANEFSRIR